MIYEQAKPTDLFLDSVGVVTHVRYSDTPYWNYDLLKSRLVELGVKHIRDEVAESVTKTTDISRLQDLGRSGIKLTLLSMPWLGNTPTSTRDTAVTLKDSLAAVEGPNEWDVTSKATYQGKAFPDGAVLYQTQLYYAIKGTAGLYSTPVVGPSMYNGNQTDTMSTKWVPCDFGNVHSYPGGREPSESRLSGVFIPWAQRTCVGKPVMATETGYTNAMAHTGIWQRPVNELVGGKYLNRLIFDYFNRGVTRTFIYELFDQGLSTTDPEKRFGLVRNDGSRKPAFTAISNTLSL
ncbi:MAG: hypothetical protein HC860_12765 [Alkalinema sp. RU_4_3]|nr:hypothetical protein [Alkalinema sp. RU_4_3]